MLVFHPQMSRTQVSEALPKRHSHGARAASLLLFTFAGIRSWAPQSRCASRRQIHQTKCGNFYGRLVSCQPLGVIAETLSRRGAYSATT